jgi:MFS family permease
LILFFIRASAATLAVDADSDSPSDDGKASIPYSRAIRTGIFWVFALSISFFGLVNSGVALFNENILFERGFDRQMYHTLMLLPWPFALAANLGVGYFARKIKLTYLMFGSLLLMGLLKIVFPSIQTAPQIYAYTIALGFSAGALTVLFFIVWADLFGQKEVGKILGLAQMMSVVASAIGPIFFAYSKAWTDSYSPAFFISGGLTLLFAVLALVVKIPNREV